MNINRALLTIEQFVASTDSIGSKYRQVMEILAMYHIDAQVYVHEFTIDITVAIAGAAPYHIDEVTYVANL